MRDVVPQHCVDTSDDDQFPSLPPLPFRKGPDSAFHPTIPSSHLVEQAWRLLLAGELRSAPINNSTKMLLF